MGELSKNLGKKIKQIREMRGIKQITLAERLNMEPSNLTRIENGYQFPKEENLVKIAQILDVEVGDLFKNDSCPSREQMLIKVSEIVNKMDDSDIVFLYNFLKLFRLTR